MTYNDTLNYIFQKLPMFSRMGSAAFKKDLTNIRILCDKLGNPQNKFKSIHIAGTNGKGSTSHMLAAILQTAGYKTGLYTSPHLHDFRERIRINGDMIPEQTVVDFVEKLKPLIEEIEPSFFEITVAMAFVFFAEAEVEIAVVEVGLGGRLDSTNIITPELSVITNIGWDHMNLLGNSLPEIAGEKAGIIKQNVPVVIGETLPETKAVFQQIAAGKKAEIWWAENQFSIGKTQVERSSLSVEFRKKDGGVLCLSTDLGGLYQVQNLRTVLTAVAALKDAGWNISDTVVAEALMQVKQKTGLAGRWDVIQEHPTIVLEVAHNADGIQRMVEHIAQIPYNRLHLVLGMVKDKDVSQVLPLLPVKACYYFTAAHIPRALPAAELQRAAEQFSLSGSVYENVNAALQAAKQNAGVDDLIVVCGSIFLVAEVQRF